MKFSYCTIVRAGTLSSYILGADEVQITRNPIPRHLLMAAVIGHNSFAFDIDGLRCYDPLGRIKVNIRICEKWFGGPLNRKVLYAKFNSLLNLKYPTLRDTLFLVLLSVSRA